MRLTSHADFEFEPGGKRKRPCTIAIDCDSVLFPINELVVLPLLSAHLGREVEKDEITSWSYGDIPDGKRIAYEAFKQTGLYDGFGPDKETAEKLALLRALYQRVIAISAPFAQHASSKWSYLRRCGFEHEDIFLCADKGMVRWDVLVDDAPKYAQTLGPGRVVVFDQPWNRLPSLSDHQRAYGWSDVQRKVAGLLP
jgi:5'(3')-deoxyribonucleotidase